MKTISLFDPDKETWIPRNKKVMGNSATSIDIGHVNLMQGGVSRTLVSLVIMIADLHLRLPYLTKRSGLIARKILLDLV